MTIEPSPEPWLGGRSAGLAGWFSWGVATSADRDLFFQHRQILSGWGPCQVLAVSGPKLGPTRTGWAVDPPASPVWFSWVVATLADRDRFFQDRQVLSGWGPCPSESLLGQAVVSPERSLR